MSPRTIESLLRNDLLRGELFHAAEIILRAVQLHSRSGDLRLKCALLSGRNLNLRLRLPRYPRTTGCRTSASEICICLSKLDRKLRSIELHQQLTFIGVIVLGHADFLHVSADLRDDWDDVSVYCCIVGGLVPATVHVLLRAPEEREYRDDYSHTHCDLTAS